MSICFNRSVCQMVKQHLNPSPPHISLRNWQSNRHTLHAGVCNKKVVSTSFSSSLFSFFAPLLLSLFVCTNSMSLRKHSLRVYPHFNNNHIYGLFISSRVRLSRKAINRRGGMTCRKKQVCFEHTVTFMMEARHQPKGFFIYGALLTHILTINKAICYNL